MSSIINQLNEIYNIKGQIKEVANIPTDEFAAFPSYIQTAISSGGATGYIDITENGQHNIATYEYAYVAVPQQEVPVVPAGYTYVSGYTTLSYNGQYDVSSYAYAYVEAEVPPGFIYPTGYAYITTNGDFPIREFAYANINVPTSGGLDWDDVAQAGYIVPAGTVNIHDNRTVDVKDYAYAAVDVPIPSGYILPAGSKTITANAMGIDVATYAYVDVDVPTSGGISDGRNITAVRFSEDSTNYTYLTKTGTEFTYTGYFTGTSGSTPTGGIELAHVELQVRIADETYQEWVDDHYETMPKWRNSGCASNSVDYFGDWLGNNYGGSADPSIPTDTLITYNLVSLIDEYGAGFGVQNINMYGWENYRVDYTLRIPEDYYYRGSSYTYFDWTITGTRETSSE